VEAVEAVETEVVVAVLVVCYKELDILWDQISYTQFKLVRAVLVKTQEQYQMAQIQFSPQGVQMLLH
jgi:hypothetical protein